MQMHNSPRPKAAQISGRALLGALKYAKVLGGEDGPSALISRLPTEELQLFSRPLRASAWYPYSIYGGLLRSIDGWPTTESDDPMRAFGRWGLQRDAGTVLRILSVFSSVEGLVQRGFGAWGAFLWNRHCNQGEVFLADSGEGTATMGLRGFPAIAKAHCRLTCGYLEAMGKAVGAHSIRMTHTLCVHRGDPHCEYRGEWD
ncbi:MAG: hypothetical protein AAF657_17300 [Acidobacteriota bacterium]